MFLKQSTAATIVMGPFVDATDGVTAETGLTISQADVRLSKNGGAFAQKGDATACSHMENGYYSCPLNTTDTGTLGHLRVAVNESGALPVWRDYVILPANVYDSLVAGSDKLDVDSYQVTAGAITAAAIATGAIDADAVAGDAVTEIQNGLATAAALQAVDDLVDDLESRLTAARAGYLDNLSGGVVALASTLATVLAYVDELESRLTSARAGYLDVLNSGVPLAAGAITEAKFTTGGLNAIADAILKRDWTAVTGEASRSVLNALRFLRNKWTAIGATLTVSKEDDSTTAWSAVITKDAASDPITGSDPT